MAMAWVRPGAMAIAWVRAGGDGVLGVGAGGGDGEGAGEGDGKGAGESDGEGGGEGKDAGEGQIPPSPIGTYLVVPRHVWANGRLGNWALQMIGKVLTIMPRLCLGLCLQRLCLQRVGADEAADLKEVKEESRKKNEFVRPLPALPARLPPTCPPDNPVQFLPPPPLPLCSNVDPRTELPGATFAGGCCPRQ
jgi:hypothetical protein